MVERIIREGDECLYQPKIHSDRIKELYRVKQITGLPMTVILDEAIRLYVAQFVSTLEWKEGDMKGFQAEDEYIEKEKEQSMRETDEWEDGSMYGF